jgi:hypothetical protein
MKKLRQSIDTKSIGYTPLHFQSTTAVDSNMIAYSNIQKNSMTDGLMYLFYEISNQ